MLKPLKIGSIVIPEPFVLAPLAGVSDLPYRLISRRLGFRLAFIEMISVHALTHDSKKTAKLLESTPEDRPLGIQLLARDEEHLIKSLEIIKPMGHEIIDFNAACPVRKVARRGEGAALMKEPEKLQNLLSCLVKRAEGTPVTVKIRSGWDHESVNAAEVAKRAEDAGVAAVFIHGRTRAQHYSGTVDYTSIYAARQAVKIPLIASGDVLSPELARKMMEETGADGLLMARGAMGNPWIYRETAEFLRTGIRPPRPTMAEILRVMREHLSLCVEHYGERTTHKIYRKFFIWYTKGIPGARPLRSLATQANSVADIEAAIVALEGLAHEAPAPA